MFEGNSQAQASTEKIAQHSLLFIAGTGISRVSGLLRDMAMAVAFGASAELAAFMVAFRFSNLLRRLLSESALSSCFIPQFEKIRLEDPGEGRAFFRDFSLSLLIVLLGAVLFCNGLLRFLGLFCVSYGEILSLTRLMMPGLIFISLYGLSNAVLNCRQHFFLPSLAPIAFNIIWAIGALIVAQKEAPFSKMAAFVVLAYIGQWLITAPPLFSWLRDLRWSGWLKARPFSPQVRAVAKPFFLGMVGLGAGQINSFIDTLFARSASLEGPAYLWYAIRLQQLPLALFGVGLASALLPPLSRAVKRGDVEEGERLLSYCLSRSFALLLPATLGLLLVGKPVVTLLFGHGHFHADSALETAKALSGYAWGLVPMGWTLILAPLFYARGDYRTPMKGTLIALVANAILNGLFIFGFEMGAESVAYATSLSALLNCAYLKMKWGGGFNFPVLLKISVCGLLATALGFKGHFLCQIALFTAGYFSAAFCLKVKEILELLRLLRSK